jgi:hypothetical protein
MKTSIFLFLISGFACALCAQDESQMGILWSVNLQEYTGPVSGEIILKGLQGETIHTEQFDGETNAIGTVEHRIQSSPGTPIDYAQVIEVCYTLMTPEGALLASGMHPVYAEPKALYAYLAGETETFGGHVFDSDRASIDALINPDPQIRTELLAQSFIPLTQESTFRPVATESIYRQGTSQTFVTQQSVQVRHIGTGEKHPIMFGRRDDGFGVAGSDDTEVPSRRQDEIEYFYTVHIPELSEVNHGFAVIVKDGPGSGTHTNAAMYMENKNHELGEAVFAHGALRGSQHEGISGLIGGMNGSGAGLEGLVDADPPAGGFGYGVTGDSQSRPSASAAALLGPGFYTGTFVMTSDARFKTAVRTDSEMLSKVMQLRPSVYRFRLDTPYGLPDGEHYGFLAQEMAEVFPELVAQLLLPEDPGLDAMHVSPIVEYQGINYLEMVSILTASLQELNAKVEYLRDLQGQTKSTR